MKSSAAIFLAALASGALAKPADPVLGYQDTMGQYSFGYSAPFQARSEARSLDGVTRGSYSYVDGAGLIQSTDYMADGENGFRVVATNLPQAPVPVQDTPEVAAARAAHLLAVEEAARSAEAPEQPEVDTLIVPKIAEPAIAEAEIQKEEAGSSEPAIETEAAAAPVPEAEPAVESRVAENAAEKESQESGRAVEGQEAAVAPVIASAAASLPVPLIPVNFDLQPSISAYTGRPAGAKAGQVLPQATPVQGITPAGTTLKSLPAPQLVQVVPQVALVGEPAAPRAPEAVSARAIEWTHYPIARGPFAQAAPVNIIPLGYDPSIPSFYRYAPFPYVAYNVL